MFNIFREARIDTLEKRVQELEYTVNFSTVGYAGIPVNQVLYLLFNHFRLSIKTLPSSTVIVSEGKDEIITKG